ncbi:MAG: hypothetical protein ACI9BW_002202 [Gammaproteobacteria bacterium]|jgi:hypothetical protein
MDELKKTKLSATARAAARAHPTLKNALVVLSLLTSFIAAPSWAAFVTTQEAKLESEIFGTTNFGFQIDLRFNPVTELVVDADLLDINDGDFNALDALFSGARNTIELFFVDAVSYCGVAGNFVGCADAPGNTVIVNSSAAANGSWGHVLLAHEIGHNLLGVTHETGNNVMNGNVGSAAHVDFTDTQVTAILDSNLVREQGSNRFIVIDPILVTTAAAVVPIPGALVLILSAIGSLRLFSGRARQNATPA